MEYMRMKQFEEIEGNLCHDLTANLNLINSDDRRTEITQEGVQAEVHQDEDESRGDEDDDDDDFSFVFTAGDDTSSISTDAVFNDRQIRPVFPLFDLDLLSDYDSESSEDLLPHRPPVKVFAQVSNLSSSSSESDEIDGIAAGPYCVWTKKGKDKKNNSTGFSKLWRFREFVNRSNSDGRDAFVFLNNSTASMKKEKVAANKVASSLEKTTATASESESSSEKKTFDTGVIRNNSVTGAGGKVKKAGKGKTAAMSAHEIYIRNKALHEDRRRSYLPYRPELVGFFTNVHGGLSRNVHPF